MTAPMSNLAVPPDAAKLAAGLVDSAINILALRPAPGNWDVKRTEMDLRHTKRWIEDRVHTDVGSFLWCAQVYALAVGWSEERLRRHIKLEAWRRRHGKRKGYRVMTSGYGGARGVSVGRAAR